MATDDKARQPSLAGKTTYWKGDLAVYTGKTEMLHGGLFYEIELAEGHLKGEKKVTSKGPDPEASGTRYHVARHALGQNVQGALGRGGVEWEVFDSRTSPSTAVFVSRSEDDAIAESRRLNAGSVDVGPLPHATLRFALERDEAESRARSEHRAMVKDPLYAHYAPITAARGGKVQTEDEYVARKIPPGKARCSICGRVGSKANLAKHCATCRSSTVKESGSIKCREESCSRGLGHSGEHGSPSLPGLSGRETRSLAAFQSAAEKASAKAERSERRQDHRDALAAHLLAARAAEAAGESDVQWHHEKRAERHLEIVG